MTTRTKVASPEATASAVTTPAETEQTESTPAASAPTPHSFSELGLEPKLLEVLTKNGFVTPTPIQQSAIPVGMNGEDIIGIAQTGTGKTLAFGLPILNTYIKNGNRSRGRALIILPTRELALQVDETLQKVGHPFRLRTAVLIGGAPMRPQQSALRANPDIIVATPGRLIDHLQSRIVDLRTVDTLVLDEADRMLDMGFAPQIKQILKEVPEERQTMLFSATMPEQIVNIANNYMRQPTRVEIARAGTMAEDITQELFIVPQDEKNDLLMKVLYEYSGTVLVFARTRSRASRIARYIQRAGHSAAEIHSDRTLVQRRAALDGFKQGKHRILVATDIAARGIDVSDIELVLNYDLPDNADDYVHRIGRTGRAGKSGHAISFAAPDQGADMRDIEKVIRSEVPVSQHSTGQFDRIGSSSRSRSSRRGQGGSRSGNANGSGGGRGPSSRPQGGSSSRDGANREGSRDGARPAQRSGEGIDPTQPRAAHGLHYSNEGYQRPRSLRRGGRSFSGRGNS
ncbi:MAG TPA: DEAD/DEAH box helicase [Abditibacteriaceae bacterium]|jgi:ATP-dependent RNA helicase RhlE